MLYSRSAMDTRILYTNRSDFDTRLSGMRFVAVLGILPAQIECVQSSGHEARIAQPRNARHILIVLSFAPEVTRHCALGLFLITTASLWSMSDELSFDLTQPSWLRNALANPKRIWNSWPVLLERDAQREALRTHSRETAGTVETVPTENPFSVWSA